MLSCWQTDGFIHVRGTQGTLLLYLQYFFFSSDMFGPSDDGLHGAEKTLKCEFPIDVLLLFECLSSSSVFFCLYSFSLMSLNE